MKSNEPLEDSPISVAKFYKSFRTMQLRLRMRSADLEYEYLKALTQYMFTQTLPEEMSFEVALAIDGAKPNIDKDIENKLNGAMGGAPIGNKNRVGKTKKSMVKAVDVAEDNGLPVDVPSYTEPIVTSMVTEETTPVSTNDNVNDNVKDEEEDENDNIIHSVFSFSKQLDYTNSYRMFKEELKGENVQKVLKEYNCDYTTLLKAVENLVKINGKEGSWMTWKHFSPSSFITSKVFSKFLPDNFKESEFIDSKKLDKPVVIPFSETRPFKIAKLKEHFPKCKCGKYFCMNINYTGLNNDYECNDCGVGIRPNEDCTAWVTYKCNIVTAEQRAANMAIFDRFTKSMTASN